MAVVKANHFPSFVATLKRAIINDLKSGGIKAKVEFEPVPTTKLYRITVLAPQFEKLRHFERQNLVWRIAEKTLSPNEQLRVSMILTLTPQELGE
jgi:hypothetical protein